MFRRDQARRQVNAAVQRLRASARRLDVRTGGIASTVWRAARSFTEARGAEAAAGLAYYTLFSLFPLLLALVALGSLFFDSQQAFQEAVKLVTDAFPVSRSLIESNLRQILNLRGPVGIVGLVGALWSASGAFAILTRTISGAWPDAGARNPLESRMLALGMVGTLAVLLIMSLLLSTGLNVVSRLRLPLAQDASLYDSLLWAWLSDLVPWLFSVLLFTALYRWVPDARVPWRAALGAGVVVAAAWEIAGNAFAWYVGSGMARYNLVYGSLGAVVALMFWVYVSGWILGFGAHLSAAIAGRLPPPSPGPSRQPGPQGPATR